MIQHPTPTFPIRYSNYDDAHLEGVKCYGATGDGTTDDTSAINSAIAAGGTLYFPPGTYKVTEPLVVPAGVDVLMDGSILYAGTGIALTIGANADVNYYRRIQGLWVTRATNSGWTDEADIGVKLINCHACDISTRYISDFTIGMQCMGHGHGFAYNNVRLGKFADNKWGLDLDNENESSTVGWTNQNTWIGGTWKAENHGAGIDRRGVRITSHSSAKQRCGQNVFIGPSFELNLTLATTGNPSGTAIPVIIEWGRRNAFLNCRTEGCSTTFARMANTSEYNQFSVLYGRTTGNFTLDEVGSTPSSLILGDDRGPFPVSPTLIPTISGSRGDGAALADLLTKGAAAGLWMDGTSA
jgi:hypothetical protein